MLKFLHAILFSPQYEKQRYRSGLALYVLVVILGSLPGARAEMAHYASGLVLHSAGYAILTFLLFSGSPGTSAARAVKSVLTVMLMGAFDEFVQSFLPYRHGSVLDWLVDCNAAFVTALLLTFFWPAQPSAPSA